MLFKFSKMRISFIVALTLLISSFSYVQATDGRCEIIEVDKKQPLYQTNFKASTVQSLIQKQQEDEDLTLEQAKGKVGELLARKVIEKRKVNSLSGYVSITTMFKNQGCTIQEELRSNADQGIDDIFVVLRTDGWINRRYAPIFHEAKYNGKCSLKLKDTVTLCQQLSFQWLDGNLKKVQKRAKAQVCFNDHNALVIQACTKCTEEFQENIKWLYKMLTNGKFYRTASLLCANGTLRIYNVNGH
ncbi:hypothetical protein IM40_00235 [Candidatus Paracaedimonas acanthamoebae]|nr:hypothetical protein IM40_00235 [Candidatus Paracaedimonas acanthamoebae]